MSTREILWVEDDPDHRLLLRLATANTPLAGRYDVAEDVATGIAALRDAAAAGRPYRLVAVDLQMPGGSGLDVLRSPELAGTTSELVVFSSSNRDEDRRRSEAIGARYRTKPMTIEGWAELGHELVALLDDPGPASARPDDAT